MAIRKSMEQTVVVQGNRDLWLTKVETALIQAKFTKVQSNKTTYQITGNYKKLTVWGEIAIALLPDGPSVTKLAIKSTANVDNIYALISSPNKKIIASFLEQIS